MKLRFGVHTGVARTSTAELQALWRRIEDAGFDWISIWDHFYAADGTGEPMCLEAVSIHAALALATTRVRCGSLVYSVGYRHPAVLANAMATLDQLSGGRITLGLGAGWLDAEYRAYGIPFPPAPVRLRQLDEGIQCVRALLTEESATFAGEYFSLHDARCEPKPVQARLPLWIGGGGEKVTLRIAAQHADGWNVPFVDPAAYARKVEVLHAHCERLGRNPSTITKSVNLALAWTEEDLRRQFADMADFVRPSVLSGSAQQVIDRVAAYRDAGAEWVIVALRAPFDADGMERFAAEVMPAFA
ncbi:MAG TPA: TIGR03560 family F420-dependent LLM class oxidoreductase [Acidimicrobiia bacterium]|jgi:F420-dependent oxidoreductase-like protein|nr:TIGR03560 family F420-dependent LLM class oxidoreductase [Acidimicrobiia bacterium]